jgi:transcription elongation factor GreB
VSRPTSNAWRICKGTLRYFNQRLSSAQVAVAATSTDKVQIGSRVTYADEHDTERRVQLVGEDQADASKGLINWDSPLGRALLGARLNDEVLWQRPAGDQVIEVIRIEPA